MQRIRAGGRHLVKLVAISLGFALDLLVLGGEIAILRLAAHGFAPDAPRMKRAAEEPAPPGAVVAPMAPSAQQVYDRAEKEGDTVIGWKLDPAQRAELLQQFPPLFAEPVADHVTLTRGSAAAGLPEETEAEIVGRAHDGRGVEAMVVRLGGTTDRPDGSTYHITWSLGPGREAVESNDILRDELWEMLDLPMPVKLIPARFA